MLFSQRLRLAREKRGLSRRQLADLAGLSNAYVTLAERAGEVGVSTIQNPKLPTVQRLAKALRVPVVWLAFGVGRAPFRAWKAAA